MAGEYPNLNFPLVYRLRRGWRFAFVGIGAIFALIGIVGLLFAPEMSEFLSGQVVVAVIFLGFGVFGAYIVLAMLRTRVVLHADAIELHEAFTTRRMAREVIAGRRLLYVQHGPPIIKLIPRYTEMRALTLAQYLEIDADFEAWFEGIADIDAEERQVSLDAVLDDPQLAGSKEEKLAGLERARRIARGITFATFAVCGWVFFYPHPYDPAIACAAIMPWIAIVTAARGGPLYRLNASRNDVGADLSAAVLLPGFALAMRALLDTRVYDWEKLFMLAIVATALCVLLMVALVREVRADTAVIGVVSVIMLAYGYGVVGLANMQLDRSEPTIHPTRVLGAHVSSGKTTSHYLKLGPWGPSRTAEDVEVDKDYYETGSRRETVCVYLFPGALGARWYVVWDCRA